MSAQGAGDKQEFVEAIFEASQGVQDNCAVWNKMLIVTVPDPITHGWTAGERGIIKVGRDTGASYEDCGYHMYLATARLVGLRYCYQVNNVFSGE